jgi:3',5'-cyclic AMP phosphodiesterase CpdA
MKKYSFNYVALALGLAMLLATGSLLAQTGTSTNASTLTFVQITDTHIGDSQNLQRTEQVVDAINKLKLPIMFVVHTGDFYYNTITNQEIMQAGLTAWRKLKYPLYVTAGNHDILAHNLTNSLVAFVQNVGPLQTNAEYMGVQCLFLYTECLREGSTIVNYQPLDWLESTLAQHPSQPTLIFHHAPFVPNMYPKDLDVCLHGLLKQYPVKAMITGHVHADEMFWAEDVPIYICPPVSDLFGRQAAYRIYNYENGKLSYSTRYIAPAAK